MITKRQKQVLDFITDHQGRKGYAPSLDEIRKKLKLSSVSTAHFHVSKLRDLGLLSKEKNKPRSIEAFGRETMIKIPLLGTIAAGQPIEAIQNKEMIAVPKSKISSSSEIYALRVVGSSMIDENINDGDVVLVRQQETAENGQKVVALIDNHEATLKKFYKERGHIRLQPANKNMEPLIFRNGRDVSIQGIVLDVIREEVRSPIQFPEYKETKKYTEVPLNKIICGDAVEVMRTMSSDSVDLVITSPPYDDLRNYNGYSFNLDGMTKGLFRVMKKGGVVVWVVGDQTIKGDETGTSFRQALYFKQVGFNLFDTMIYLKTPRGAVGNNKTYWQTFEYMFVFSKGTPKTINLLKDRENKDERDGDSGTKRLSDGSLLKLKRAGYSKYGRRTNVWKYLIGKGHSATDNIAYKHPAIFPEKLVQDHITSWSNLGDVVLDPMCGSGTTCKMAKLNKRDFIGIDVSSEYCKIAEERLKQKSLF
ncbi:MAG: Modification methylase BamHII [Parcubacteria group bacterium GW2011_GWA2_43_9b]|nr:MAG: Modification methylase BamHII [Parcubacteria group bacterium GW2011_GWA2_43_9b]